MLETAWLTLRVAAAVALGFFLPGYCLARCLRAPSRLVWSFPLSLLLLFLAIFTDGCLGLPVTATAVSPILIAISLALAAIGQRQRPLPPVRSANLLGADQSAPIPNWIKACFLALLSALLAAVVWRTTLLPLIGYDVRFRWGFLARRMLQQRGFGFYPPVSAADYRLYFYTDGIPPLVSFSYWWLYAATGGYHPAFTSILIAAQLACTLGFTYRIGRALVSPLAGLFAVAILGSSTLYVHATSIGQETGLTALSIAAMLCAVVEAAPDKSARFPWPPMVLAGSAAALGALSREYGCAFPILGAVTVLWLGGRIKDAIILCATAVLTAGPWYARNLLRSGNPFYGDQFAGLYVNPVHNAIFFDYYQSQLGVSTWHAGQWGAVAWELLKEGSLQMTVGIAGAVFFFRKLGFLAVIAGVIAVLWLYSVGETAGAWPYTARVLTPLLVALSVPAAALLARLAIRPGGGATIAAVLGIGLLWSVVVSTMHPLFPNPELFAHWKDLIVLRQPVRRSWWDDLCQRLPPGSRVLCDNAYMYSDLQERDLADPGMQDAASATGPGSVATDKKLDLVPVWSPEVAFIANNALTPAAIRSKLLARGIRYVIVENTLVGQFLTHHFRFYREGMPSWTLLYTNKNNSFYVFGIS